MEVNSVIQCCKDPRVYIILAALAEYSLVTWEYGNSCRMGQAI